MNLLDVLAKEAASHRVYKETDVFGMLKEAQRSYWRARLADLLGGLAGIGTTVGVGGLTGLATGNPLLGLGAAAAASPTLGKQVGGKVWQSVAGLDEPEAPPVPVQGQGSPVLLPQPPPAQVPVAA